MLQEPNNDQVVGPQSAHFSFDPDTADLAARTEIEEGRFMPQRDRGSCLGRALG